MEAASAPMQTFNVYRLLADGKIAGPAIVVQCENDRQALVAAGRVLTAQRLEVWQGARYVGVVQGARAGKPCRK
jgi:hypothetical protein